MLFVVFLIVTVSYIIQCSLVLDHVNQDGIYLSDYCPKMKYCAEGAHVMCMYYDPKKVMGPKCRDTKNVTITPTLANKLLDVTNALRSKVSQGAEKGKHGEPLPRGYGIFRLKWDSELATFAQLLANQCLLRHDFCRATKKFPDPGQAASVVRFHPPDWTPASKGGNFTSKGFNEERLIYAITQSLRTWYMQKSSVTIDMVTNYPDWSKDPSNLEGMIYLSLIYGSATHMGCGISAYTDYVYYSQQVHLIYHSVLVICNFSAQPRKNAAVYNTVPPTDTESSFNACGCPVGSIEDDDCLCLPVPREQDASTTNLQNSKSCPAGMECDPTVVLLPIITVEDAPPDKLIKPDRRTGNISIGQITQDAENTIDSFEELFDNNQSGDKGILKKSRKTYDLPHFHSNGKKQRPAVHSSAVTIRSRRFDKPSETSEHKASQNDNRKHTQRSSVFSKTPIFELPGSHYFLQSIKRDVLPRKNFSTGKQLVNHIYLNNKHSMISPIKTRKYHSKETTANNINVVKSVETINGFESKDHKTNTEHHEEVHFYDILTPETPPNSVEHKTVTNKKVNKIKPFQDGYKSEGNKVSEENDKKFMSLLNTLEQEVKYLDLGEEEKQIFDAKIKKIYGKVVGKTINEPIIHGKNQIIVLKSANRDNGSKNDDDDDVVHKLEPSFDANYDSKFIEELTFQNKLNTETETDDKYTKTGVEQDEFDRPLVSKQKPFNYNDINKSARRNGFFRHKSRSYLTSPEAMRNRYDNEIKGRKAYKNARRNELKLRHRSNSLDYKINKNIYGNDAYEDLLSSERRKYYQDKLESVERKLDNARLYSRRKDPGRSPHMRAMKTSFRSDNQMNPLYTGRARILHGY